jgi:hypothetical protein
MERLVEWTMDDIENYVRSISLVSQAANETELLMFNQLDLQFKTIDTEERIVTGVSMRPDIKIKRKDENGELYYGFFSKETVKKAAQIFFKSNANANRSNLEHQFEVDGVYVFESWIVEDPKMDKAVTLGFTDIEKGDWWVSMKIENDDVWNNFLKTGLIRGFSVEINAKETPVDSFSLIDDVLDSNISVQDKFAILTELIKTL